MKWTLVTGGAKGLGAEICRTLAAQGGSIAIHTRKSYEEAMALKAQCQRLGGNAEIIEGDFSSLDGIEDFIERCGERFQDIAAVINNVGPYLTKSAASTSLREWDALFQANLNAAFAISQSCMSSLAANHGSIVNIGMAGIGRQQAEVASTGYRLAKMALLMLTKSLAKEWAPLGISVNMVSPGYLENAVDLPSNEKLPMGRPATLREAAEIVAFLLDPHHHYITGQQIEVAGGVGL